MIELFELLLIVFVCWRGHRLEKQVTTLRRFIDMPRTVVIVADEFNSTISPRARADIAKAKLPC